MPKECDKLVVVEEEEEAEVTDFSLTKE